MNVRMEIRGTAAVVDFLGSIDARFGRGALRLINRAALGIQRDAKRAAPVDTGLLRQQIKVIFTRGGFAADIIADVPYAREVEDGTGTLAGHGAYRGMPPPAALADWARRHRMAGREYVIARAIFRRGGHKPRPFLTPAFERHSADLFERLRQLVARTVRSS
jgi:hypothetical protein